MYDSLGEPPVLVASAELGYHLGEEEEALVDVLGLLDPAGLDSPVRRLRGGLLRGVVHVELLAAGQVDEVLGQPRLPERFRRRSGRLRSWRAT